MNRKNIEYGVRGMISGVFIGMFVSVCWLQSALNWNTPEINDLFLIIVYIEALIGGVVGLIVGFFRDRL